jgi:hypothetical protein
VNVSIAFGSLIQRKKERRSWVSFYVISVLNKYPVIGSEHNIAITYLLAYLLASEGSEVQKVQDYVRQRRSTDTIDRGD